MLKAECGGGGGSMRSVDDTMPRGVEFIHPFKTIIKVAAG
jgi:hypothetical protein